MKYQKLGKTDLNASVVAFGAWGIGGGIVWPDMSLGVKDVERLLDAATELGINYIDTAPVYGTGVSEDLLGKASFRPSAPSTGGGTAATTTMSGTGSPSTTTPAPGR